MSQKLCHYTLGARYLYFKRNAENFGVRVIRKVLENTVYGPTFGSTESHLFLFAAQCFNTESMQKFILWHNCV
jgi:hypothetical protein